MELKRKAHEKLLNWKQKQNGRTVVMLEGGQTRWQEFSCNAVCTKRVPFLSTH